MPTDSEKISALEKQVSELRAVVQYLGTYADRTTAFLVQAPFALREGITSVQYQFGERATAKFPGFFKMN